MNLKIWLLKKVLHKKSPFKDHNSTDADVFKLKPLLEYLSNVVGKVESKK